MNFIQSYKAYRLRKLEVKLIELIHQQSIDSFKRLTGHYKKSDSKITKKINRVKNKISKFRTLKYRVC